MEPLSKSFDPKSAEPLWYDYWLKKRVFHAEDKSEKKPYCIVIPPPNITGMLHMGHALNNVLQDIMIRFRRMEGYNTLWMPGTDHAGIATQNVVEKHLSAQGISRHDLGREKFIEKVWEWKDKWGGEIINQLKRLGCSCDWERLRFTMDAGLSRAVREAFVRLYRDGLIYQGDYIVNWCPRCHTAISDLEVEYEEVASYLWYIRYPLTEGGGEIVVATTRPETMLGDTAVAVNPRDERHRDKIGKEALLPLLNRRIPIIADEYVSMDFGTGAVKITPACDPHDFAIAERHHLPLIKIMDGDAFINEAGGPYQGLYRYEARERILADLDRGHYLAGKEPYKHNVGRCYRCGMDIEPMVSRQWFVRVKPLAKPAINAVLKGKTRIIPTSWETTYFEWMNNIRDWCISRQIWWGHRIPVWYCDCGNVIVTTEDPQMCHACGKNTIKQDEDVLDTWFSSSLWPFSTLGWPEKTEALRTFYPTSLLITGFDILFFWVARMMMMGLYLMKEVPFRDVYLHALVRDEKGEKMSKSKGNIIDPIEMVDKYGADAFRFTLAAFTAQGRDIKMSEERIAGYKFFVNKLWNAAKFVEANTERPAEKVSHEELSIIDRWILSRMNDTISAVKKGLNEYRFNEAAAAIYQFVWHEFCDWYIELVKPILYRKTTKGSTKAAKYVLLNVLDTILRLLHPFMPFVTEEIWQHLFAEDSPLMIASFPGENTELNDRSAEGDMSLLIDTITAIRNIRGEMGIAPSKKLPVVVHTKEEKSKELIEWGKDFIMALANLEGINVSLIPIEPFGAATAVVADCRIFVMLEGIVDITAEKLRLKKEIEKISRDLEMVSKKLSNRDFLAKAKEDVVAKEERRYHELREKKAVLERALKKFEDIDRPSQSITL